MNQSNEIEKIAISLSKAQSRILGAIKDKTNPYFNSSYADLADVWDAVREPLTDNELGVVQLLKHEDPHIYLETKLIHSSGQWFSSKLLLIQGGKRDMQTLGAAITYARRFSLAAITGVPQVDNDGNECCQPQPQKKTPEKKQPAPAPAPAPEQDKLRPIDKLRILVGNATNGGKDELARIFVCEKLGVNELQDIQNCSNQKIEEMITTMKSI